MLLIALLLLLGPFSAEVRWRRGDDAALRLTLRLWGVPLPLQTAEKLIRRRAAQSASPADPLLVWKLRGLRLAGTVLRADHARRFLLRHVRIRRLDGSIRLAMADASGTAMAAGFLCGASQRLHRHLPRARLSVTPDFLAPRTRLHLHCMISCPMGILLAAGVMVLMAAAGEIREHPLKKEA